MNHLTGYEAELQIPHVFPDFNWMNPFSPHVFPHEFLTTQLPSPLIPTRVTPWLREALQFEKTPPL